MIHIRGIETAFPGNIVDNSFFGENIANTANVMFAGAQYRRHISRKQKASDLITEASMKLIARFGLDPAADIDMILTNVSVPDEVFTGCGAVVAHKTGVKPKHIYDIHNAGCVSFIAMLELAEVMMDARGAKSALIACVQTAGGRIFSLHTVRKKVQSAIPGDGCGVALVTRDGPGGRVVASVLESFPENAEDMFGTCDDNRRYWEPGLSEGYIDFDEAKVAKIISRGNKLVPLMAHKACEKAGIKAEDLDFLVTNQPNLHFLRNWREALLMKPEQHIHTFTDYANLFGAGIPINLAKGLNEGMIQSGNLVCLAGFSHAGDYSGAAIVSW
jgi:3-oxoacyl-[acyl-carrier-protein] synthase III